jgi:hypothetical protein
MAFCNTGEVELVRPLDIAYGVKIKLTDASGADVPKTALGAKFGLKFDKLRSVSDSRVYPNIATGPYKDNPFCSGGKFLPRPNELFNIEKPGVYNLEIQMQMFRQSGSLDAKERSKSLFVFPVVRMRIEKS